MKKLMLLALFCCAGFVRAQSGAVCRRESVCLPGDKVFFTVTLPETKAPAETTTPETKTTPDGKRYQVTFSSAKGALVPIDLIPLAELPGLNAPATSRCPPASSLTAAPKGFCLVLPGDLADGTYSVKIADAQNPAVALSGLNPAQIVVQRPAITAVWPEGSFLEATTGNVRANTMVVLGKGFRRGDTTPVIPTPAAGNTGSTDSLRVRFPYTATPDKCPPLASNKQRINCYEIKPDSDQQVTLKFTGLTRVRGPSRWLWMARRPTSRT